MRADPNRRPDDSISLARRLDRWRRQLFSPASDKRDLAWWRERILLACLGISAFFGIVVLVPSVLLALQEGRLVLGLIDSAACAVVLALFFSRRLSYRFRAGAILVLCYTVGIGVCLSYGLMSGGPAWLFFSVIFSAVFFGLNGAVAALGVNVVSLAVIVSLTQQGVLGADLAVFKTTGHALVAGVNYIFLNAVAAVSVAVLLGGLQEKAAQEEKTASDLHQERMELLTAKEILQEEIESRKSIEAEGKRGAVSGDGRADARDHLRNETRRGVVLRESKRLRTIRVHRSRL